MGDDFVISAHALERFQERFPEQWVNDDVAAQTIYREVMEGFANGRASYVAPIELALHDLDRWQAGRGVFVWTPKKVRGYVVVEASEGQLVATVLVGKSTEQARRMLYGDEKQRKESLDTPDGEDET